MVMKLSRISDEILLYFVIAVIALCVVTIAPIFTYYVVGYDTPFIESLVDIALFITLIASLMSLLAFGRSIENAVNVFYTTWIVLAITIYFYYIVGYGILMLFGY
jgi:hypothetical protein